MYYWYCRIPCVSYFTVSVGIHFLPLRSSRALPFVVAFPLVNPSRDIFPMCPSGFVIIVSTLLDLAPRFWTWNALFRSTVERSTASVGGDSVERVTAVPLVPLCLL